MRFTGKPSIGIVDASIESQRLIQSETSWRKTSKIFRSTVYWRWFEWYNWYINNTSGETLDIGFQWKPGSGLWQLNIICEKWSRHSLSGICFWMQVLYHFSLKHAVLSNRCHCRPIGRVNSLKNCVVWVRIPPMAPFFLCIHNWISIHLCLPQRVNNLCYEW